MSTAFVLTTVNKPVVLEQFLDNCQEYGHSDVEFIIIGDIASHPDTESFIQHLSERGGRVLYYSAIAQEQLLRRVPKFQQFLPYNTVQRRNLGYLLAGERGHERIISIDDDNFPLEGVDFVGCHSRVGKTLELETVSSDNGWFNSCSLTETVPGRQYYHRGYPLPLRWKDGNMTRNSRKARVVVNVGLWLEDPDVDTITRLEEPFRVTGICTTPEILGVARGTLFPYNSQNTAFHRDLLPTLYLVAIADNGLIDHVGGSLNFRYDDIWMSYFQKLALDHMGDQVCIGAPHVRQNRNNHNFIEIGKSVV